MAGPTMASADIKDVSAKAVRVDPPGLDGLLAVPPGAQGIIIFAHGAGSSRFQPA